VGFFQGSSLKGRKENRGQKTATSPPPKLGWYKDGIYSIKKKGERQLCTSTPISSGTIKFRGTGHGGVARDTVFMDRCREGRTKGKFRKTPNGEGEYVKWEFRFQGGWFERWPRGCWAVAKGKKEMRCGPASKYENVRGGRRFHMSRTTNQVCI